MTKPVSGYLKLHGKIPHVEAPERSIAMQVRDGMLARLKLMRFFQGFTFTRSHVLMIQTNLIPYCNVYFLGEQLTEDGNNNTGEVRFNSVVRIGFQVILLNNDPDRMEDRLDDAYQAIFNGLLRDPTLYNNDRFQIEAFIRGARSHSYGNAGLQNNETPFGELRAELHCDLGAIEYEPLVEDMLETVYVETVHPPGDTQNPHVITIYDVDHPPEE